MSDDEDQSDSSSEAEDEPDHKDKKDTEAELALKKRREAQQPKSAKGLDEAGKELLQSNREERGRMDDEIRELRERNEKRKKEREIEEKRLAAERAAEDERRKAVEEEKRRKKEEEDLKKQQARASKLAEFEKWKSIKPNFTINKKEEEDNDDSPAVPKKSKEQLDAEKKAILNQRIIPLKVDGLDVSKLTEKAKELHKIIYRLEGEKYDYEQRFKAQQVDMMELAERARQANKVGRGGLKRIQTTSDEIDQIQARFAGTPAKVEMYSKYERQKDKRAYEERKDLYTGPSCYCPPDRIKPKKIVKWTEEGLPLYEELTNDAKEQ